ncbi:hypothetical protein HanPI659440_Chr10g0372671 [Helianthus annuus]|nr:hypothetical protein HanPI659440_Chr10g0372671 [Helianthus annuus]
MSTSTKAGGSKRRQTKPKYPPGPNRAIINWKEEELHNLIQRFKFPFDLGVQFPIAGSTALDSPPGYLMLYAAFFREGNFRLPMSKFLGEILTNRDPSKSFHDWKQKFFYIRRVVIPIDMHYRTESEGVPKVVVAASYADKEWYKTVTRRPTPIIQLEEKALVAAGMSLMWVPREPTAFPVYACKGKGYSLMNVFDLKVGGEIATTLLPEGEPAWTARIRDNFLHPSSESVTSYGTVILGAPFVAAADLDKSPTREGTILLSSEESTGSSHGLIRHSSRQVPNSDLSQTQKVPLVLLPPLLTRLLLLQSQNGKRLRRRRLRRESQRRSLLKSHLVHRLVSVFLRLNSWTM